MKKNNFIICFLVAFSIIVTSCANHKHQNNKAELTHTKTNEIQFDSVAAATYGADQYGMKRYVIAFLKEGPNSDLDSARAYELQIGHMKNIGKMADEGKLAVAGPFLDNGEIRGLYIFNVESLEEAQKLANTDPAIKEGVLTLELKEWYGTAALMAVNKIHKTLSKQQIVQKEE